MTTLQLTPAQHAILAYAIAHTAGQIDWFPDTVKGGARTKVLTGLANRGLAANQDSAWRVTDAGYALFWPRSTQPNALSTAQEAALEADVAAAEAAFAPAGPRRLLLAAARLYRGLEQTGGFLPDPPICRFADPVCSVPRG